MELSSPSQELMGDVANTQNQMAQIAPNNTAPVPDSLTILESTATGASNDGVAGPGTREFSIATPRSAALARELARGVDPKEYGPRGGRPGSRGAAARSASGPRSVSKPKPGTAQLQLENTDLRRQLALARSQVQHMVGVARTNEDAWEHQKVIGEHEKQQAIALSQAQVTHVAAIAQHEAEACRSAESYARNASEEAQAHFLDATQKGEQLQKQRNEMMAMEAQASAIVVASQSQQEIVTRELSRVAEKERLQHQEYTSTMIKFAEARENAGTAEQQAANSAQQIHHLEAIMANRHESFQEAHTAAQRMEVENTNLRQHFSAEYGRLSLVNEGLRTQLAVMQTDKQQNTSIVDVRGKLMQLEKDNTAIMETLTIRTQELQRAQATIIEKQMCVDDLTQRINNSAPPDGFVPIQVAQKFIAERELVIEALKAENDQQAQQIRQLMDMMMEQEQAGGEAQSKKVPEEKGEEYWREVLKIPAKNKQESLFLTPERRTNDDNQNTGASREARPQGESFAPEASPVWPSYPNVASDGQDKRRPKAVVAPAFPNINEQTSWLSKVAKNLVAASVHDDRREVEWFMQVKTKSFEELANSGEVRFAPLDALLCTALEPTLPKALERTYSTKCEQALLTKNDVLTGRQLAWLILNYFKTSDHMSIVYSHQTLMELDWFGDNNIDQFLHQFQSCVDNLAHPLPDEALRDILFDKMKKSEKLFYDDIAHFKRQKASAGLGKPATDFSLDYLKGCLQREISDRLEQRQIEARRRINSQNAQNWNKDRRFDDTHHPTGIDPEERRRLMALLEHNPATPGVTTNNSSTQKTDKQTNKQDKGGGKGSKGSKGKRECFWHQLSLRVGGRCKFEPNCDFKHSNSKIPDEEFQKLLKERSTERSTENTESPPKFVVLEDGKKAPVCCNNFRNTGKCRNKERFGKCKFRHLTQDEFEQECKALNPEA